MMKHLKIFISSLLGGIAIAIAGMIYLSINSSDLLTHLMASIMFSFGLLVITGFGLSLYTGKVAYVFDNKRDYLLDLLISFIGNFAGALGIGYLLYATRLYNVDTMNKLFESKVVDSTLFDVFVLSLMCGILVYLAVEAYRSKTLPPVFKVFLVIMAVGIFVACGFEHVIANIFYFSFGNLWSWKTFGYVMMAGLGNSVGSILFHEAKKFVFKAPASNI